MLENEINENSLRLNRDFKDRFNTLDYGSDTYEHFLLNYYSVANMIHVDLCHQPENVPK